MNFSCHLKAKYPSAKKAKEVARRKEGRQWYFCKSCKFYHVGNSVR